MNLRLSSKQIQTFAVLFCMIVMNISLSARADNSPLLIKDLGEGHCLVRVNTNQKYLLLPVEDASPDVRISMIVNNKEVKNFDVRLAIHKVDYFVPVDLSDYSGKLISFKFKMNSNDPVRVNLSPDNTACCKEMKLSDTFDTSNREKFRPTYHFSPLYGWMNDPNGMVYKDGEYHLFYQYNPYGSKWGNMNWGHAISKDLVNWEHRPVAIAPDAFGTIFSGSAVIDHHNTAGFGAGAIVAIYTQNGDRQVQSIAYSTDNGRTFTKYENNPVLVSAARDFRDPKVFWYEGSKRWIMVLAVGQEMQFFSSPNLKDWTFESHITGFWECPELFELPVDGNKDNTKWVMYGASGTYMLGVFDGKKFTPESGKYYYSTGSIYAAQTFTNIPESDGRRIQIGWGRISHPGMPFNGMMLFPTELSLRTTKDGIRLFSKPIDELDRLQTSVGKWRALTADKADELLRQYKDASTLRIRTTLKLSHATNAGLNLFGQSLLDYDMNYNRINGVFYSPEDMTSMEIAADIILDKTSIEVYIDDGAYSYSMERRPDLKNREGFHFFGNNIEVKEMEVYTFRSIWE